MSMIVVGILGVSLSAIFVKYSQAPSVVTAAYRLLWTVALMLPMVFGSRNFRKELAAADRRTVVLCAVSGIFLALHFTAWFESLNQTSVASSTAIVCTEVIWVALGFLAVLGGRIPKMAAASIAVTVAGSLMIALSDYSAGGNHLWGDALALAAAMFSAVYTLIGRQVRRGMSTTVYTFIVYVFRTEPDRAWDELRGGGTAVGGVFHLTGAQHFQLVPEVFFALLCLSLQAVRAGGGLPVRYDAVWGNPGRASGGGRSGDGGRRAFVLPGGVRAGGPPGRGERGGQSLMK